MTFSKTGTKNFNLSWNRYIYREREGQREFLGLMDLSSMKYIKPKKTQKSLFKTCQLFWDMTKTICLCQNGSRHKKGILKIGQKMRFRAAKMFQSHFLALFSRKNCF